MRICLVAHGLPPRERGGVENHVAHVAQALADRGARVSVFVPAKDPPRPHLAERREDRGDWDVTWLTVDARPQTAAEAAAPPGVAEHFAAWLERERPDVCHFHHLIGLGPQLIEIARSRDVAVVWTAHDYHAICHRATLLRPDLELCEGPTAEGCARCDLALGHLNEQPGLGDYHAGVLPAQLTRAARARLRALLDGELSAAGISDDHWRSALSERGRLERARAEALASVDLAIAPTAFLRDRLVAAGHDPARILERSYAIPSAALTALSPPGEGAPVRFGFVGSVIKHKGVHVLVEAFAALDQHAELGIWGDSNDRAYVDEVTAAARAAGATWNGAFAPDELPSVLASIDVLVVPSLWNENQPFVIREAFAARRPVVASALGALLENVRDEVDGLLVPPGDARALAAALERLAREPELVRELSGHAPAVRTIEEEAAELDDIYARLVKGARSRALERLPALESVHGLAERRLELRRTPVAELYEQVLVGLDGLREGLGLEPESAGPVAAAADARGAERLREHFQRSADEVAWLRGSLAARVAAEGELERRASWQAQVAEDRGAAAVAHAECARGLEEALASKGDQAEWLERVAAAQAREIAWREGQQAELERELEAARAARSATEGERDWLRERLRAVEGERDWLRESSCAVEDERDWLRECLRTVEGERDWLRATLHAIEGERDRLRESVAKLRDELDTAGAERDRAASDAAWRRSEMQAAARAARRGILGWLLNRHELGRILAGWERPESGSEEQAP